MADETLEDEERDDESLEDDEVEPKRPGGGFESWAPGPLPPIAPDGGPAPQVPDLPDPIPAATEGNFICLRGPCRHYWEIELPFESGNPKGAFAELGLRTPRQIARSCVCGPREMELTDNCVYACNRWDPLTPEETAARSARRDRYLAEHPEVLTDSDIDDAIEGDDDEPDLAKG